MLSRDRTAADQAAAALEGDTPPPVPWAPDAPPETPAAEQARLRAALDQGREWPFFRDRSLDPPPPVAEDAVS